MTSDTIAEIERNIQAAKPIAELADALDRLKTNRDFKKLILEGYFQQEAIRLVQLKADATFQSAERQRAILTQIDAIGALNQYFETVFFKANQARKAIAADEQSLIELAQESQEARDA